MTTKLWTCFLLSEPVGNVKRWDRKSKNTWWSPDQPLLIHRGVYYYAACAERWSSASHPETGTCTFAGTLSHCMKPQQRRPGGTGALNEAHGPASVSGFCWHLCHQHMKGQNQVWQVTTLSTSGLNTLLKASVTYWKCWVYVKEFILDFLVPSDNIAYNLALYK